MAAIMYGMYAIQGAAVGVHCAVQWHSVTHYATLCHNVPHCTALGHSGTHYTTMCHNVPHSDTLWLIMSQCATMFQPVPHSDTLSHTKPHFVTMWHYVQFCSSLFHRATVSHSLPQRAITVSLSVTVFYTIIHCSTQFHIEMRVPHCTTLCHITDIKNTQRKKH